MGDRGNGVLRFFDRYLGIPLVFLSGRFMRHRKIPPRVESIGILATAAIGDSLLLSPVLKDLRKAYPQSRFSLFCGPLVRNVMEMTVEGMEFIVIPIDNPLRALTVIRQSAFDVFIDCGPWPRLNSLLTRFSRSSCRIGFRSLKQYRHYAYDISVEHRNDCHEYENLCRLVTPLGVRVESRPFLGETQIDRENPYVLIHMFPSGYKAHYKEWSDEHWVALIDGLTREGISLCLTGGPEDRVPAERIAGKCQRTHLIKNEAGRKTLKETGELIRKALLVISVNTGIMHMAAAYNQRLIALHGPTSVLRWGPLCADAINFTARTPHAGCLHLGFEYDRQDIRSLDTIGAEEVLEAALIMGKEER